MGIANAMNEWVIMGVDPGTIITGYGVLSTCDGITFVPIDCGRIKPPQKYNLSDRYVIIYDALNELLSKYPPHALAIETQYVDMRKKNPQVAIKLGMARGVVVLAARKKNIPVFQYPPSRIKTAVTGRGCASKKQVLEMVSSRLSLPMNSVYTDAADALATAICHGQSLEFMKSRTYEI